MRLGCSKTFTYESKSITYILKEERKVLQIPIFVVYKCNSWVNIEITKSYSLGLLRAFLKIYYTLLSLSCKLTIELCIVY